MFLILGMLALQSTPSVFRVFPPRSRRRRNKTRSQRSSETGFGRWTQLRVGESSEFRSSLQLFRGPIMWILDVFDVLNSLRRVWDFVFR